MTQSLDLLHMEYTWHQRVHTCDLDYYTCPSTFDNFYDFVENRTNSYTKDEIYEFLNEVENV